MVWFRKTASAPNFLDQYFHPPCRLHYQIIRWLSSKFPAKKNQQCLSDWLRRKIVCATIGGMTLLILLRALAIYCCYNCNESLNSFANLGKLKLQMLAENWVIRNDFGIGHGFRAVISHRCAISKKRCEKKCGRTGIYAEKYGKGKNWKEVPLAIALHWSPATGSGSGKRVIMIPLRPKCGTLSAGGIFSTVKSEISLSITVGYEKFAVRTVNWWKRPRRWKLSNLSKKPRLSVVRANFGGSGAKRKLEADVARFAFPLFTSLDFPAYLFVYLPFVALRQT